ncbi:MAG: hypothetical protein BWY99_02878 [Synergistetes bacterium ADurb.BinA166]|nr:MAG: hypothetical protein BWY99_02878 [Synergistetes bacterium ADurb.BinA166]
MAAMIASASSALFCMNRVRAFWSLRRLTSGGALPISWSSR